MKTISQKSSIPLVLHGATKAPTSIPEKAVKYGATLDGAKGGSEYQLQQATNLGVAKKEH